MERRIAQGPVTSPAGPGPAARTERGPDDTTMWAGVLIFVAMLAIYIVSNPDRANFYNHFVWQASAWLEGQAGIRYPVTATPTSPGNDYFQDVLPILDPNGSIARPSAPPVPAAAGASCCCRLSPSAA